MLKWILGGLLIACMIAILTPFMFMAVISGVIGGSEQNNTASICQVPNIGVPAERAGEITIKGRPIDEEQLSNAQIIFTAGLNRGFSLRDIKIAYMVAFQESSMRNLRYGHLDSLGMFQQRATWGTASQRLDPNYSTGKFYDVLATIDERDEMSLLDVALAVQRPSKAAYLSPANNFLGDDRYLAADQLLALFGRDTGTKPNVFLVGDSISLGAESKIRTTFKSAGFGKVTVNASVSRAITKPGITGGQRTSGLEVLDNETARKQVKESQVIVIALGTNGEGSPGEFRSNLNQLIDKIRVANSDASIYVVNIFSPANPLRKEYNRIIRDISAPKRFTMVNVARENIPTEDDIHPTPQGQQMFADAIVTRVSGSQSAAARAQVEECLRQAAAASSVGAAGLQGPVVRVDSPGRLVPIPGFPDTRVDNRILPNVVAIIAKYKLRVGDCYAETGHAINGEHPLGLGCDFYPGEGGSWELVDELAKWAEPSQNQPREPFRWVGYGGDVNHGNPDNCTPMSNGACAPHIHLSWEHGPAKPFTRAPWVKVIQVQTSRNVPYNDPGVGQKGSDGLVPRAGSLREFVVNNWSCDKLDRLPCVNEIGGYRVVEDPRAPQDHELGLSIDIVIGPGVGTYPGRNEAAFGWAMACYLAENANALGIQYLIWSGKIWNLSRTAEGGPGRCTNQKSGWRDYSGQGVTQGHYDHIHITVRTN